MKNQVLSIDQMKRLVKLGVDISKASMCWIKFPNESELLEYTVSVHDEFCYEMSLLDPIPTFTLQDIIELLPINIRNRGSLFIGKHLNIDRYNKDNSDKSPLYQGYYGISPIVSEYETSIEAAYNTLIWVIKNNHFKTNNHGSK